MPVSDDLSCDRSNTFERQVGEPEINEGGLIVPSLNATSSRFPNFSKKSVYPDFVFTSSAAKTAISVPITGKKQSAIRRRLLVQAISPSNLLYKTIASANLNVPCKVLSIPHPAYHILTKSTE